jgi:hypothetical protein
MDAATKRILKNRHTIRDRNTYAPGHAELETTMIN